MPPPITSAAPLGADSTWPTGQFEPLTAGVEVLVTCPGGISLGSGSILSFMIRSNSNFGLAPAGASIPTDV